MRGANWPIASILTLQASPGCQWAGDEGAMLMVLMVISTWPNRTE